MVQITPPNLRVCAWWKVPAKCFNIGHILHTYTKTQSCNYKICFAGTFHRAQTLKLERVTHQRQGEKKHATDHTYTYIYYIITDAWKSIVIPMKTQLLHLRSRDDWCEKKWPKVYKPFKNFFTFLSSICFSFSSKWKGPKPKWRLNCLFFYAAACIFTQQTLFIWKDLAI